MTPSDCRDLMVMPVNHPTQIILDTRASFANYLGAVQQVLQDDPSNNPEFDVNHFDLPDYLDEMGSLVVEVIQNKEQMTERLHKVVNDPLRLAPPGITNSEHVIHIAQYFSRVCLDAYHKALTVGLFQYASRMPYGFDNWAMYCLTLRYTPPTPSYPGIGHRGMTPLPAMLQIDEAEFINSGAPIQLRDRGALARMMVEQRQALTNVVVTAMGLLGSAENFHPGVVNTLPPSDELIKPNRIVNPNFTKWTRGMDLGADFDGDTGNPTRRYQPPVVTHYPRMVVAPNGETWMDLGNYHADAEL